MGDRGVSGFIVRIIQFSCLALLFAGPSAAFAAGGRLLGVAEARDLAPHTESFALPATRNLLAIAQDPSAWRRTSESETDRLVALGLLNIQFNLLSDLERRRDAVERGDEHFDYEFFFLISLAEMSEREISGKTASVAEDQRLAWFASSVIVDDALDGIRDILSLDSGSPEDPEVNVELAKALESWLDTATVSYRETASYLDTPDNFISGPYIETIRQIGQAANGLSTAKLEESAERLRRAFPNGSVRSEEMRRAARVASSYGTVLQPVMVVLQPELKSVFDQGLVKAEGALIAMSGGIERFLVSGVVSETDCDNQKDDDADTAVDCADPDCGEALVCCRNCI